MSAQPEFQYNVPIKLLVDDWLTDLKRLGRREQSLRNYRFALADWTDLLVRDLAEPVGRQKLRAWLDTLMETRAPKTVSHRLISFKGFCTWLKDEGYPIDPLILQKKKFVVKVDEKERRVFTDAEVQLLVKASRQRRRKWQTKSRGNRDHILVRFLLLTGLRASEVAELMPDWLVNGDRFEVHVPGNKAKGRRPRTIPIHNTGFIKELRLFARERELAAPDEPLFGVTAPGLLVWARRLGELAGVKNASPHLFRHTFATNFLRENPGKLVTLQKLLGHRDIKTTMKYVHLNDDDLRSGWTLKDPGR